MLKVTFGLEELDEAGKPPGKVQFQLVAPGETPLKTTIKGGHPVPVEGLALILATCAFTKFAVSSPKTSIHSFLFNGKTGF